ncbi:MAG: ATP synthase F1 subunit gamma [Actinomycetota bacterium]|nr:ATP synthase F1 subunit gamma [Actinomycetota bacterium]MDA3013577.1 ATP synthase F1 subunit gamma [Actinomycetota bacterium]
MASAELRKINRRIKSVKSTKKITRAMELIASSRIVKAQQRLNTSKNYSRILGEIIRELANSGSLPKPPDYSGKKNVTLVVITSDRGLAGAYNSNILKIAESRRNEYLADGAEVQVVTVGKKADGYFNYRSINPKSSFEGVTDEPKFENALSIMNPLVEEYNTGKTHHIEIIYTEYKSAITQRAVFEQLLPFENLNTEEEKTKGNYTFEPSAAEVLNEIIPNYTNAAIFTALLNSSTSEHASRMRAMKAATDNAEDLIKILSRQSNQARQAEITTEISEIVGGAEALAG